MILFLWLCEVTSRVHCLSCVDPSISPLPSVAWYLAPADVALHHRWAVAVPSEEDNRCFQLFRVAVLVLMMINDCRLYMYIEAYMYCTYIMNTHRFDI